MKEGFGYDKKNMHFLMLRNTMMEWNDFLVNRFNMRTLFMLHYGGNIKIIFFILKKQAASVMTRNFYSRKNNDVNDSL